MTKIVDSTSPVDYATTKTPASYACTTCGRNGVKLWRDYQTFLNHQTLSCVDCACAAQNPPIDSALIDETGSHDHVFTDNDDKTVNLGPTDTIGWLVPAVPTAENDTFWGYTSVPQNGCDWWDRLPLR